MNTLTRQLSLTFVLFALLPVTVLSLFAAHYLTQNANQQAQQTLEAETRTRAYQILERLLHINSQAKNTTPLAATALAENTSLEWLRSIGSSTQVQQWQQQLAQGDPVLVTATDAGSGSTTTYLVLGQDDDGAKVELQRLPLTTDQVLGARDSRNLNFETCVFNHDQRSLFASSLELCRNLGSQWQGPIEHKGSIRFQSSAERYTAHHRSLFLQHQFATGSWKIAVIQRHNDLISDTLLLRKNFIALAIAVILALSLGSGIVIRKRMAPLKSIMSGIKRVAARDYSKPVVVNADNEFSELATAFNQMSTKVSSQLSMLAGLADFDHALITSSGKAQIYNVVLSQTRQLLGAEVVGVISASSTGGGHQLLLENSAGRTEHLLDPGTLAAAQESLEAGTIQALNRDQIGTEEIFRVAGATIEYIELLPVAGQKGLGTIIMLGYDKAPQQDQALQSAAKTYVDRIAIALKNASSEAKLYYQAHYDSLSQLPNRMSMQERLESNIVQAQRSQQSFAILFIDLDEFKLINDALGHHCGDHMIKAMAQRLQQTVRKGDLTARMGGDEFVIVSGNFANCDTAAAEVAKMATKVMCAIAVPLQIGGREIRSGSSVGIAVYPRDGKDATGLLQSADTAMYHAKSLGRNNFQFFSEQLNAASSALMALSSDLKRALQNSEFELHYQPKLELGTGHITGAEALIRWHHPERGMVPPGEFIEAAERMGLINDIGDWTMAETGRQIQRWRASGLSIPRISVNLSALQLQQPDILAKISRWLTEFNLQPGDLELEIVEGILLDDIEETSARLRQIRKLGIHISIDDYGTGYSSLSYIRSFPVDCLKIDRCFISNLPENSADRAIVHSSIVLAHNLGMIVIAEGVETLAQLELLQELKCDQIQGYYFSRPLPTSQFSEFLNAHSDTKISQLRKLKTGNSST